MKQPRIRLSQSRDSQSICFGCSFSSHLHLSMCLFIAPGGPRKLHRGQKPSKKPKTCFQSAHRATCTRYFSRINTEFDDKFVSCPSPLERNRDPQNNPAKDPECASSLGLSTLGYRVADQCKEDFASSHGRDARITLEAAPVNGSCLLDSILETRTTSRVLGVGVMLLIPDCGCFPSYDSQNTKVDQRQRWRHLRMTQSSRGHHRSVQAEEKHARP